MKHTAYCQARCLRLASNSPNGLLSLSFLLLMAALLVSGSVQAVFLSEPQPQVRLVGHAMQRQALDFERASIAFDNKDYVYSAQLLQQLASEGHVQAQYLLATQYDVGLGVAKNEKKSFYWYKQAARAGIVVAQHNLAVAYARGNGVATSLAKAITWWKRAALAGNTDSQYNLGIIYASGRASIKPDLKQAFKWWRMAAINGDAMAQFNLGALYANGFDKRNHTCEASRWWKKSAANGLKRAQLALALLQSQQEYAVCR